MNKNCQLFYKRLRTLFPSIGFAEGKFLRDIKMQLRDYSIENPNAEYEDVVKFFGNPEDVYENYLDTQENRKINSKIKIEIYLKYFKWALCAIVCALIIICITFFCYLQKSYVGFYNSIPDFKESAVKEGEIIDED